jgi:protein gp37
MQDEELLANLIASVMLKSNCFCTVNPTGWEAKRKAFIGTMARRFGEDYPQDVVRRVAEVQFETGLEIIKLRDSNPQQQHR